MKMRLGFVSNSSSASFVIRKHYLSENQIDLIHHHLWKGRKMGTYGFNGWDNQSDEWSIVETDDTIEGNVHMDNFNMKQYLERIGIDPKHIAFDHRG